MEELFITEEELDYFTDVPDRVCEDTVYYKSKMTFEEAVRACNGVTLDEFSRLLDESINRLMQEP